MTMDDGRRTTAGARSLPVVYRLSSVAVVAASLFAAMYFVTALLRIFYPYDLDFIEDSMLIQSLRFALGQPVYIAPSIEFVPHVYMPLYSWLGGLLFRVFGVSYVPLRLLSFAATLTTAALIFYIAQREGGERWLAFVCAGLYLGGYRITGFWNELARVDSLFVALSMCGLVLGLYARPEGSSKTLRVLSAAVVLALAFFAKQTALAFGVGLAVYLLMTLGRRAWVFIGTLVGIIAVGLGVLNTATGGWFAYHTFLIAGADRVEIGRVFHYIGFELFGVMAGLSVIAVVAAGIGWRRSGVGVLRSQPWLLMIGVAAIISGTGRASVGGNVNNLMAVYALLCIAPALLWKEIHREAAKDAKNTKSILAPFASSRLSSGKAAIVTAVVLIQFALGAYNPLRYIPTTQMRESGDRLSERIRSIDGEVLVMMHPYYAWLADKGPSAQIAEIWYLHAWSGVPLPQDFVDRIRERYYAVIVSSESMFETDPEIQGLIEQYYVRAEMIDGPPTMTGMVVRPSVIYVPK